MSTDTEKRNRFRELWHETGLDLPELAAALGRPLGTITKFTHHGASSRTPPVEVLDAMDKLVLDRARALVEARGYSLVLVDDEVDLNWGVRAPSATLSRTRQSAFTGAAKQINPDEIADEWRDWIESGGFAKLAPMRERADRRSRATFRGGIEPDLGVDGSCDGQAMLEELSEVVRALSTTSDVSP
jgi:hypothetical protein